MSSSAPHEPSLRTASESADGQMSILRYLPDDEHIPRQAFSNLANKEVCIGTSHTSAYD